MAMFRCSVRSKVLDMDTMVNVVIPYDRYDEKGNPGAYDKVLYLLHGLKQNADAWPRLSSAERYAGYYGYTLVMPEVQRSFYTDMAHGPRYFTFLTDELPQMMQDIFKLPHDPAHTFVGGLSMGGYGALKCALTYPDRYAGAMCFSSGFYALNRPEFLQRAYYSKAELQGVMGDDLSLPPADDMLRLMQSEAVQKNKPLLYIACGTEDPLYPHSTKMRDALREHGLPLQYEEWPGIHDWRFWDVALEKGMLYMNAQLAQR